MADMERIGALVDQISTLQEQIAALFAELASAFREEELGAEAPETPDGGEWPDDIPAPGAARRQPPEPAEPSGLEEIEERTPPAPATRQPAARPAGSRPGPAAAKPAPAVDRDKLIARLTQQLDEIFGGSDTTLQERVNVVVDKYHVSSADDLVKLSTEKLSAFNVEMLVAVEPDETA